MSRPGLSPSPRTAAQAGGGWRAGVGRVLRAVAVGLAVAGAATGALARSTADEFPTVALTQLPPEAQQTKRLILAGGPFPYRKDGTVFFNRERLLPAHPRGFYREYTVRTPGASNRGARRIVCGGEVPTAPQACYYTADHYASFRRIVAGR